jgi:predicted nucleic acid-binding protein
MVSCLVDTNIIIDLLRGYPLALTWLASQSQPAVCRVVYIEVIQGAEDKRKQQDALRLLKRFAMVEHTQADFIWATRQVIRHSLAHRVDVTDALIAAPAYRLNLPFYTRNDKHFLPMIPTLLNVPY